MKSKINKKLLLKSILGITIITFLISSIYLISTLSVNNTPTSDLTISVTVSITSITIAFLIMFFLYKKQSYLSYKQITQDAYNINSFLPNETKSGIIIYDENKKINYVSTYLLMESFSSYLGKDISEFQLKDGENVTLKYKNNFYHLKQFPQSNTIFVKNVTEEEILKKYILNKRPFLIIVKIKYSSFSFSKDNLKQNLELKFYDFFSKFASNCKAVYIEKKSTEVLHYIFGNWETTQSYFEKNNKFYNELVENVKEFKQYISISIGVIHGNFKFEELEISALNNIMHAENRGGNQVVIQNENGHVEFLGALEKNENDSTQRIELKFYFDNFLLKMKKAQTILISAHQFADLDALASTLALASFLREIMLENCYVIMESYDDTTKDVLMKMDSKFKKMIISEKEAQNMINAKTYLVVTDISDLKRSQVSNIYTNIEEENIFIIDHHRAGEKFQPKHPKNIYIETNASSSSELISELIRFKDEELIRNNFEYEATLLLSGIILDTNKLARSTLSKTYEIISWLMKLGADKSLAYKWNEQEFSSVALIKKIYNKAQRIYGGVVFSSIINENVEGGTIANLADRLLEFKDINASFVLALSEGTNTYKLSARSNGQINVQVICERLGGGGHFNAAAVLFKNVDDINALQKKLIEQITNYFIEAKNDKLKRRLKK